MSFPATRLRRLRQQSHLRALIRETDVASARLILPCFVRPGHNIKRPIAALPGHFHWSPDRLAKTLGRVRQQGITALLLFGLPRRKDARASEAYDPHGAVQETVRRLKDRDPALVVMTDVCLCGYMRHGHCGVVQRRHPRTVNREPFTIDNDATLELLAKVAVSHAEAGADLVAPSDMMDGRVKAIRQALDHRGYTHVGILSYAAKYASAFYGPFREAADSAPQRGDRRSYQMDARNVREALREVALDLDEGADLVMVKPALPYLDVIAAVRAKFPVPIAAFQVSGEFAMIKAAVARGWMNEPSAVMESLTAIKRAGADLIITYFAQAAARQLRHQRMR